MPALRGTGFTELMSGAAGKLDGIHFRVRRQSRRATMRDDRGARTTDSATAADATSESKGSTAVTTIPKAQQTRRFEVVTEAVATTIEVDQNGRVRGVNYLKGGAEYFQPADVVLLASYVYEMFGCSFSPRRSRIRTVSPTITARSAGTTSVTTRAPPSTRCFRTT